MERGLACCSGRTDVGDEVVWRWWWERRRLGDGMTETKQIHDQIVIGNLLKWCGRRWSRAEAEEEAHRARRMLVCPCLSFLRNFMTFLFVLVSVNVCAEERASRSKLPHLRGKKEPTHFPTKKKRGSGPYQEIFFISLLRAPS